jgi:hypothetical protein
MHKHNLALLLSLLFFAAATFAQSGENQFSVTSVCSDESREFVEISVGAAITEISIIPNDPQANAVYWYPDAAATRRFWFSLESESLYISAWYSGGNAGVINYRLGSAEACERSAAPSVPMNECLGIALVDFTELIAYQPQEEGFVVDSLFYSFHDTLSFIVPADMVWRWSLYVDGLHVLSFEQTEAQACHVTDIYSQSAQ